MKMLKMDGTTWRQSGILVKFQIQFENGLELETSSIHHGWGGVTLVTDLHTGKSLGFTRVYTLWGSSERCVNLERLLDAIKKNSTKFVEFFEENSSRNTHARHAYLDEESGEYCMCR